MFAHRFGSSWEVFAPAKLNLFLDVLGPRADGFHDLESLLVPLRLYDHLSWQPGQQSSQPLSLEILSHSGDAAPLSAGADNLVLKAAHRLAAVAGVQPHGVFRLTKRIPTQAGMGGGSSDAAAALVVANAAWGLGYSQSRLADISAEIGSDVPFFFANGPAICRGRGELVEPVAGLPNLHFVVVKPPLGVSTARVFSLWKRSEFLSDKHTKLCGMQSLVEELRRGRLAEAARWMLNRLESAAQTLLPDIAKTRQRLMKENLLASLMTGSGSACFGIAATAKQAQQIARRMAIGDSGQVFVVSSC